ncbi:MAG: AsmA-like C-terminal domain-containing protein [Planctomycetia bacterium]|nr:AsmA-like C-terminal domain-containing protein [Planctomycetia bacterium]
MRLGWRWIVWGLAFLVLAGLVAVLYFERQLDEEVRREVQKRIAAQYPHLVVAVRSARVIDGEGISVRGVTLSLPGSAGRGADLAYIDEVMLCCDAGVPQLLSGDVTIRSFAIHRPNLHFVRRPDGSTNFDQLAPSGEMDALVSLEGTIENGTLEWLDEQKTPPRLVTLRDVNLKFARRPASPQQRAKTDAQDAAEKLEPAPRALLEIQGGCRGDHLDSGTIEGVYDESSGAFTIEGDVSGLDISPEFVESLPAELQTAVAAQFAGRLRAAAHYAVAFHPAREAPWHFDVTADIQRGRIDDPRLPFPCTDLRGKVRVATDELEIKDLVARSGQTELTLSAVRAGYAENSPWTVNLKGRELPIDGRVFEVLPKEWRSAWESFSPAGLVDVEGEIRFDGRTCVPHLNVTVRNGSFAYWGYPYRVERAYGTIGWTGDKIDLNLIAYARTDKLSIVGELRSPGPNVYGDVKVTGKNVRLDQDLVAALDERPRAVVTSFRPSGSFGLWARFWREPREEWFHQHLVLSVAGGSIAYDGFPYPLQNLRGVLEGLDGAWTFKDLSASSGSARLTGDGYLVPRKDGAEVVLNVTAKDVALDQDLLGALNPPVQEVWAELQPRGRIDLNTTIQYLAGGKKLNLDVTVIPRGDSASLEPRSFPWRMEKVQGEIKFKDGRTTIVKLSGVHGDTVVATRGFAETEGGGRWHLHLDGLAIDNLAVDRDLLHAAPESFGSQLSALNIAGLLNVRGKIDIYRTDPHKPFAIVWDAELFCRRNAIDAGVRLENIYGSLKLKGSAAGDQVRSEGALKIDSLSCRDWQLTDVRGPIWIENDRVLLGAPDAEKIEPGKNPHLTASAYGGSIYGDFWIVRGEPSKFALRAYVTKADLARLALEHAAGRQSVSGKLDAALELTGTTEGVRSLAGQGAAELSDANIYELPLMVSLLKVARLQPVDGTAFTTADCRFRIQADHVYFDRLNFNGDAISLLGKGEVDFDRHVVLSFRSRAGREDARRTIPFVSDLIRGASQQFVMLNVTGTLDDPEIRNEPLPAVTEALQEIGQGLQEAAPGSKPAPRGAPRNESSRPKVFR